MKTGMISPIRDKATYDKNPPRMGNLCSIEGCTSYTYARGWCKRHYNWHRKRKLFLPSERTLIRDRICTVDGCEKHQQKTDFCNAHYKKFLLYGNPLAGPGKGNPGKPKPEGFNVTRERSVNNHGYALIRTGPGKWVLEHRLVMEQILNRPLAKDERIHHKDGNKLNNAPGNLELWLHCHPSGQRVEDAVAWAREILQRYG